MSALDYLYTTHDAAKYLKRSPSMVRKYVAQGDLKVSAATVSSLSLFHGSTIVAFAKALRWRALPRQIRCGNFVRRDDVLESPLIHRGRQARQAQLPQVATIVCPICLAETDLKAADHCHETGAVRDWLCRKCNLGLGFFGDDTDRLRRAADYIERHQTNPRSDTGFVFDEYEKAKR